MWSIREFLKNADGEFFFAEARVNYAEYVGDVAFINSPVNSAVGTILKLDGSGENAYNEKYKLNVGNHTATLVAKDKAGNESKVEIKITVKD